MSVPNTGHVHRRGESVQAFAGSSVTSQQQSCSQTILKMLMPFDSCSSTRITRSLRTRFPCHRYLLSDPLAKQEPGDKNSFLAANMSHLSHMVFFLRKSKKISSNRLLPGKFHHSTELCPSNAFLSPGSVIVLQHLLSVLSVQY